MDSHNNSPDNLNRTDNPPAIVLDSSALAYIRPIHNDSGTTTYAVCLPDGTELAVFENADIAMHAARQHDLDPMRIH